MIKTRRVYEKQEKMMAEDGTLLREAHGRPWYFHYTVNESNNI